MTIMYGAPPIPVGYLDISLPEVMYYLYLPVRMQVGGDVRLPPNVECCRSLIDAALALYPQQYRYAYLSARKGWATPDNPLNRPGWHCDGFGSDDMNFVWWRGPGTRFAIQEFHDIVPDHTVSLRQFEEQIDPKAIYSPTEATLYAINPRVVHATPIIGAPGCMRQYVKVSLSNQRYNLENNSHNYLFDYDWPLYRRELLRNDPAGAQQDFVVGEPT